MNSFANMVVSTAIGLVLVLTAACGPSSGQIQQAKTARYQISPQDLLDIALQVTQRNYKIDRMAPSGETWFATAAKWYTPTGQSITVGFDDAMKVGEGSVNLSLLVGTVRVGEYSTVAVKAVAQRYKSGMAALEQFGENDPSRPGWVSGREDELAYEIWVAARKYQVQIPGKGSLGAPAATQGPSTTAARAAVSPPPVGAPSAEPTPDSPK